VLPSGLGLPLTKSTLHFLPETVFSIADTGITTAAPAAATVAFFIKSLLSIVLSDYIFCYELAKLAAKLIRIFHFFIETTPFPTTKHQIFSDFLYFLQNNNYFCTDKQINAT
jgi:hypothetical protein